MNSRGGYRGGAIVVGAAATLTACFQVSGPIDPAIVANDLQDSGPFVANVASSRALADSIDASVQQAIVAATVPLSNGLADAGAQLAALAVAVGEEQTQLAGKVPSSGGTITGNVTVSGSMAVDALDAGTLTTRTASISTASFGDGSLSIGPVPSFTAQPVSYGLVCATPYLETFSLGGYGGIRQGCVTACGNSPVAHLCTSDEIVRSVMAGFVPHGEAYEEPGLDCSGWTVHNTATPFASANAKGDFVTFGNGNLCNDIGTHYACCR